MASERTSTLFVREEAISPVPRLVRLTARPGEILAEHEAGAMEDRVVDVALAVVSVGGAGGAVLSGTGRRFVADQPGDPTPRGEGGS